MAGQRQTFARATISRRARTLRWCGTTPASAASPCCAGDSFPAWTKDPGIGHKLINARAETAAVKRAFRAAFAKWRCLVPADGFYEWRREGSIRQPWLIARRDGGPMAFAGLWEGWRVPESAVLRGSLAERRPGDVVETFRWCKLVVIPRS